MINEPQVIELVMNKILNPVLKHASVNEQNLIPYSEIYVILGRRGFCKNETRLLGRFFESRGFVTISKRGWLINSSLNS